MLRVVSRATFLMTAAFVATAAWAAPADAICGRLPDASMTPLPTGMRAPLNARVTLTMPSTWRTRTFCEDAPRACVDGSFDLVLRHAPSDHASGAPPVVVATTLRESKAGNLATVVMTPSAPLAARTRYEVVRIERSGKVPLTILGTFATGDAIDDKPPSWPGIKSHHVSSTEPIKRGGVVTIPMECAENGVQINADTAATDEGTPPSGLRYAVWFADDGSAIDYASPPAMILQGQTIPKRNGGDELILMVPLDRDGKLALPNDKKKAKLGVRAIDAAGNPSAASEIVVKIP